MDNPFERAPMRRPNRLKNFDYTSNHAYFITVCIKNGECLLWNWQKGEWTHELSELGKVVDAAVKSVEAKQNIHICRYVIMPNHIHMIVHLDVQEGEKTDLSNVVRFIKSSVTKTVGRSIWQRSYYDHIIRNQYDFDRACEYIENNPGKWKEDKYYRVLGDL